MLSSELETGPKTLVIHILGGVSVQVGKRTSLLFNEYDDGFYRQFEIEKKVKQLSAQFPNSYHIIFIASEEVDVLSHLLSVSDIEKSFDKTGKNHTYTSKGPVSHNTCEGNCIVVKMPFSDSTDENSSMSAILGKMNSLRDSVK